MQNGTLGQRIRRARTHAKKTLAGVGREVAVITRRPGGPYTAQAVQQWETRTDVQPDIDTTVALATVLRCDLVWLLTGKMVATALGQETSPFGSLPSRGHVVAIITPEQAVKSPIDYRSEEQAHTNNPCSKKAFAIRIFDRRNAPEFRDGDSIVIDPAKKPEPGDMALAVVGGEPIFAKFVRSRRTKTKPGISMVPLDSDWSPSELTKNDRIIGSMIEHTRPGARPRSR